LCLKVWEEETAAVVSGAEGKARAASGHSPQVSCATEAGSGKTCYQGGKRSRSAAKGSTATDEAAAAGESVFEGLSAAGQSEASRLSLSILSTTQ
jgi:hypothetical protein